MVFVGHVVHPEALKLCALEDHCVLVLHRWGKIRKPVCNVHGNCLLRISNKREDKCKASLMRIVINDVYQTSFDKHHPATKLILKTV